MDDPVMAEKLITVLKEGVAHKSPKTKTHIYKACPKTRTLTGVTETKRLSDSIARLLLNPSTDEGKARARFLKNFGVLEKKSSTLCGATRQFMDSLARYIEQNHSEHLLKTHFTEQNAAALVELCTHIERNVEKSIVEPFYTRTVNALASMTKEKDRRIEHNLQYMRGKGQEFFGIKPIFSSSTQWSAASYELSFLHKRTLPCEKLKTLLDTARAIYNSYNYERNRKAAEAACDVENYEPENFFLAADDFFPIFIFVVANSTASMLELQKTFMWGLCAKESLSGEGGYYLTVFEAAIEYLHGYQITDLDSLTSSTKSMDNLKAIKSTDNLKSR